MLKPPTNISSLERFLQLPDFKPAVEFIDGRIIQKMSPLLPHSVIQSHLLMSLNAFALPKGLGRAYTELRIVFGGAARVPDLCYFTADRAPRYARRSKATQVTLPPDLIVEILSPGQPAAELRRKIRLALRHGSKLGWLIKPRHEQIHVLRPGQKAQILKVGDVLEGEGVLPEYSLSLEEIFGWFDRY